MEPTVSTTAEAKPKPAGRLFFVDNIRVYLTILVILHHLIIIYAGTGDFYGYTEGQPDLVTQVLGGYFCGVNQAYFMGLFLLISAYFVPGSYDRKGPGRFLKDRLIRLGIPLAVYSWVINPLFVYWFFYDQIGVPFFRYFPIQYFKRNPLIGAGPTWFVEVLLLFSLVYVLWRHFARSRPANPAVEPRFPGNGAIALFALLLALGTTVVRLFFVMDAFRFAALNLQLPFFAQYIALFVVGLVAYRRNWLLGLPDRTGRFWLRIAILLLILWAPMMVVNGAIHGDMSFKGGLNWQSLLWCLWESLICVSMCITVIYLFRRYLNTRGKVAAFLVPNAYAAYLIHAPVIATLAVAVAGIAVHPLLKWAMVSLVAVALCFGLSALIRKLPYTDRVL